MPALDGPSPWPPLPRPAGRDDRDRYRDAEQPQLEWLTRTRGGQSQGAIQGPVEHRRCKENNDLSKLDADIEAEQRHRNSLDKEAAEVAREPGTVQSAWAEPAGCTSMIVPVISAAGCASRSAGTTASVNAKANFMGVCAEFTLNPLNPFPRLARFIPMYPHSEE